MMAEKKRFVRAVLGADDHIIAEVSGVTNEEAVRCLHGIATAIAEAMGDDMDAETVLIGTMLTVQGVSAKSIGWGVQYDD